MTDKVSLKSQNLMRQKHKDEKRYEQCVLQQENLDYNK